MSTHPPQEENVQFYTDPHIASWLTDIAKKYNLIPAKKGDVGNIHTDNTIMSYSITNGCNITVCGKKVSDEMWSFCGIIDGKTVIDGNAYGGKWRVGQYLKFIRNGILSRYMRRKGKKETTTND